MKARMNKLKKLSAVLLSVITMSTAMLPVTAYADNIVRSAEPPKVAEISLNKTSKLPDCTDGNASYTLQGAEYSVYTNADCTQYYGKITTDGNGHGKLSNLPLGIYYVKETKASNGYSKDPQVYTCDLRSGNDAVIRGTVNSKETPLLDPVAVLIRKTGDIAPDGSMEQTLEGAEFAVKFYKSAPSTTDPATWGEQPQYDWVFKTNNGGFIGFAENFKVSGPKIPTDANGVASLPYGTVTIQEVKAPNGFAVNPKVFVVPITNNQTIVGPVYQEPTIQDLSIKLELTKFHNGEDGKKYAVANAEFKHTFPNGSTEILKTNSEGKISFKGLTKGNHTVEEVKVPDGFALNKNKIVFTVNEDNTINITSSSTVTDTDGNIELSVKDGNLVGTVENKPAPFKLQIHKKNDKDFRLEGAEFTLYTDSKCTQEFAKGVSNANGDIELGNLIPGKEYYLKETKASKGYRIPVNKDGSDIIWKIKATSYPTLGKFTFYVNDTAYTSGDGAFSVTGTPADRIVNMTIINPIGAKLPNTGSNMMFILVIAGVLLSGGAIVVSRKHKKNLI